ncbi:MAG: HU family DNA-binding protein [Bacteroides sp.]|nr:HU family DNA-binding protein [Bacteroides sp.]
MPIKYDLFQVNELSKTEGKYRARAVSSGKVTTEKLTEWIRQTSGISRAEAKGFIEVLTDSMLDFLADGYEVQLGGLGYFSVSVTSRLLDDPQEIRAESIRFNRLNFRAGKKARERLENERTVRVKQPRYKKKLPETTRQERAEILRNYLSNAPFITRADYSKITAMNQKHTAIEDLNHFIEEGWIQKYGVGRTIVYIWKK